MRQNFFMVLQPKSGGVQVKITNVLKNLQKRCLIISVSLQTVFVFGCIKEQFFFIFQGIIH